MVRQFNGYSIKNDGVQWIVRKQYVGKTKKGESVDKLDSPYYFLSFERMVTHMTNLWLMEDFNKKSSEIFKELTEINPSNGQEKEELCN